MINQRERNKVWKIMIILRSVAVRLAIKTSKCEMQSSDVTASKVVWVHRGMDENSAMLRSQCDTREYDIYYPSCSVVHQVCCNLVIDQYMEDFPIEVRLFLILVHHYRHFIHKVPSMQTLLTDPGSWFTWLDVSIKTWPLDHCLNFPAIMSFVGMIVIFSLIALKGAPFQC